MIFCLFEQSGVFKNAFKSLNFKACDAKKIFSVTKTNKNINSTSRAVRRSYIDPDFALNFIKEFILSPDEFAKIQ